MYDEDNGQVVFPSDLDLTYPDDGQGWLLLNSSLVDYTENIEIGEVCSSQYVLLDGSGLSFAFTDKNAIQVYYDGYNAKVVLPSGVTKNGNEFTISNTGMFDGDFTINDDGCIVCDGILVAKAAEAFVELPILEDNIYLVVYDGVVYASYDGNILNEILFDLNEFGQGLNETFDKLFDTEEDNVTFEEKYNDQDEKIWEGWDCEINKYNGEFTLDNVFDLLILEDISSDALFFYVCEVVEYYGGTATYKVIDDTLYTYANWSVTDIDMIKTLSLYSIEESRKLRLSESIGNGIYYLEETEAYYKDGEETQNIVIHDDYVFYFEEGMTYREWFNKYYPACLDPKYGTNDENGLYVSEEMLDTEMQPGWDSNIQCSWYKRMSCDNFGYYYNGEFTFERFYYSYGIGFVRPNDFEYDGFEYKGLWYGQGEKILVDKYEAANIYNYFIRNGYVVPEYLYVYSAFQPVSTANDISQYLTYNANTKKLTIDWDGIKEYCGINVNIEAMAINQDGEYYVLRSTITSTNSSVSFATNNSSQFGITVPGITFYYNGVVYTGFAN